MQRADNEHNNPEGPRIMAKIKHIALVTSDPDAVQRGMKDFDTFNCSGCHAANAGGPGLEEG